MQKILGLDIGETAIKAVSLEASFRSHEVRGFRSERIAVLPDADAEASSSLADRWRPAFDALSADGWLTADKIICSLPGAQVATHLVTLPFNDARRVDQTLPFEVEGLIPFDLDEVVFDYHVVSKAPGRTKLLVAVVRKDDVRDLLEALGECGVDPQVVTFSAVSLSSLWSEGYVAAALPEPLEDGTKSEPPLEAVVDVGAERTDVLLLQAGTIQFARTFSAGGEDITRAIARATTLEMEEALAAKHSTELHGGGDPTVRAAAERASAALLREIRATLSGHSARTRQQVSLVHICGGGAQLAGLPEYLSSGLGVPVRPLELADGHVFPERDMLLPAALALSLALRGLEHRDSPRMSFRKGEFAGAKSQGAIQQRVGALAVMVAVLVVLFSFSAWAKFSALENQEKALDEQLCTVTQRSLGKCETDYKVALGRMKGGTSPAASVPRMSASDVVNSLTRSFPEGGVAVLSELDVVDDLLRMRGDAKSYEAIDDLVEKLQADVCFSDVKKGRLAKGKNNRIDFDLDAKYVCGAGGRKAGG